ncbi:MAG: hypothetical protein L6R41_006962 [Letrouitia leprolyta]|nr:MAG: hypothetical protein L6R41_006962 [Letrouitia leprolyta]
MINLLDCPNEVIDLVVRNLKRREVKQTRLVCRRIALLAAPYLIDVIYISPHSKNMEVFEAVTRHPVFSTTIKHVVYDSAKFSSFSLEDYRHALISQLDQSQYNMIQRRNDDLREMMDLLQPYRLILRDSAAEKKGLQRCKGHAKFMMGYRQFIILAQQQKDNTSRSWFDRVCEGLRKLGPIQSAIVRNAWDTGCREIILDDSSGDSSEVDVDEYLDHDPGKMSGLDDVDGEWEDFSSSEATSSGHRSLQRLVALGIDGMRLVGSPLARAWTPSWLQPPSSALALSAQEIISAFDYDEWYSVGQSFDLLVRLLSAADKHPQILRVPGNHDGSEGLSPISLDSNSSLLASSSSKALTGLKTLHLRIVPYKSVPHLTLLKKFFRIPNSMMNLSLFLPLRSDEDSLVSDNSEASEDDGYIVFNFTRVFPPLRQIQLSRLRSLVLQGLGISYKNLTGLLILKLPNFSHLTLSYIQLLQGGYWEDIIEGLRHLNRIVDCCLESLSYYDIDPYQDELAELDLYEFLQANASYVVCGGRHPSLRDGEADIDSLKFLTRLNATLDRLKENLATSGPQSK